MSRPARFAVPATLLVLALALAACGGPAAEGDDEDTLAADDGGAADAALAPGSWGVVRRDQRKCMSPMCGGYFVSAIQKTTLRCADGTLQASCYVATLDLRALGLDANALDGSVALMGSGGEQLIVRGTAAASGAYGTFRVTEAHRAVKPAPVGATFYVVNSAPVLKFRKVNASASKLGQTFTISTGAGDAAARALAVAEAKTPAGLVASGTVTTSHGKTKLAASAIFLKVAAAAAPAGSCGTAETQALAAATANLLYTSESDYPFTTILRSDLGTGPATEATVRALAGTDLPANAAIHAQTVDAFFQWIARPEDASMDPSERPAAAQYRALRTLLEKDLTDLRIFRAGEIQVHVYILGRTSCGELVGLQTISIET